MPPVNLKLLHIFIAVAENKSFRQASEQLNRSKSAVSMQIRQPEEQVGVALFHRTTRRVELSSEGEQLLTHARRAIEEWDNGLRQIRDIVDIQRGTLSIGCVPTVAATILPRALNVFQKAHPGININLRELAAHDLLDSVRRRDRFWNWADRERIDGATLPSNLRRPDIRARGETFSVAEATDRRLGRTVRFSHSPQRKIDRAANRTRPGVGDT